jgi:ectoine hydroxylase-related dioxygenase (phytanoyl-CoA dioxygenase family)
MRLTRFIPKLVRSHQLVDAPEVATAKGLDRVEQILRSAGTCTITNVISSDEADAARLAVQKHAEADRVRGHHHVYGDGKIRRVWGLVGKDAIFRRLIQHPLVIAIWQRILGEDLIASSFTANIVGPGAPGGGWHVDYPYWMMRSPFPVGFLAGQTIWMLDDFTPQNGATVWIPGSQKLLRPPTPKEIKGRKTAIAQAPKGSVFFGDATFWHQCLPNHTDKERIGLLGMYARSFIHPQEDMPRQLNDEQLQGESDVLKQLLGRSILYHDEDQCPGYSRRRTATGFEP